MQATAANGGSPVDTPGREVVVVAVPPQHPYVLRSAEAAGIRLADAPVPASGDPSRWWPPAALDPDWISRHGGDADLLHVHFGTESFPAGHLTACIAAAHGVGWPVVFTAHDLDHPQLGDQAAYRDQLDELMAGADAVVTLTAGAARAVHERWGRDALVIPHPSLLPADATVPPVLASDDVRIGVHLKDLRPNVDGPAAVRAIIRAVTALRADGVPAVGEVRMHHRVRDEDARREVRALCESSDDVFLVEHERLSDSELLVALSRLDACVLPYRHGTHSGWLELCWDLGVPVAAPSVGFYAEQHPDGSVASFDLADAATLSPALIRLRSSSEATHAASAERRALVARRRDLRRHADAAAAEAHATLYRALAGRRT